MRLACPADVLSRHAARCGRVAGRAHTGERPAPALVSSVSLLVAFPVSTCQLVPAACRSCKPLVTQHCAPPPSQQAQRQAPLAWAARTHGRAGPMLPCPMSPALIPLASSPLASHMLPPFNALCRSGTSKSSTPSPTPATGKRCTSGTCAEPAHSVWPQLCIYFVHGPG